MKTSLGSSLCIGIGFLCVVHGGCGGRDEGPEESFRPEAYTEFLDQLQRDTFLFFWKEAHSDHGMIPDRSPAKEYTFHTIAGVGFGLTAYGVGAERGYITRAEARDRTLMTLRFLWEAPKGEGTSGIIGHKGFFYHFLERESGLRHQSTELSSIDTGLMMAGILFSQSYFDGDHPDEARIRALADSLYLSVQWNWMQPRPPLMGMAWRPERGMSLHDYKGYDEAMILYLLALGSPTYPIDTSAWSAFTSTYRWEEFYGQEHVNFSPLFGHQYSHVWIDYRGIRDEYMRGRGIDYFENSRRATYAQREYAKDNPRGFIGYGDDIWGLTACVGPANEKRDVKGDSIAFRRYWARGAAARDIRDDGTIAPTAAGGSVPFAPEITIPALIEMKKQYGENWLYAEYGFLDAFNPTYTFTGEQSPTGKIDPEKGWVSWEHLAIDQGPILLMIENYRTGLVWEVMKKNKYLVTGLCRAGFTGGWLEGRCEETQEPH